MTPEDVKYWLGCRRCGMQGRDIGSDGVQRCTYCGIAEPDAGEEQVTFPSDKLIWSMVDNAQRANGLEESVALNAAMYQLAVATLESVFVPEHTKGEPSRQSLWRKLFP